jgi:hypothetical protein
MTSTAVFGKMGSTLTHFPGCGTMLYNPAWSIHHDARRSAKHCLRATDAAAPADGNPEPPTLLPVPDGVLDSTRLPSIPDYEIVAELGRGGMNSAPSERSLICDLAWAVAPFG